MIFVTLGTDEHPFARLVQELDRLVGERKIRERVVVQRGFTPYSGKNLETYEILAFGELVKFIKKARVVITHGGPGSIALCLAHGKIPIVVPRDPKLGEIVDDHQLKFVRFLEKKGSIVAVYQVEDLERIIREYRASEAKYDFQKRTKEFLEKFENLLAERGLL